nr:hypothetical protein [bacterium]
DLILPIISSLNSFVYIFPGIVSLLGNYLIMRDLLSSLPGTCQQSSYMTGSQIVVDGGVLLS